MVAVAVLRVPACFGNTTQIEIGSDVLVPLFTAGYRGIS